MDIQEHKSLALNKPVKFGDTLYTTLELREPRAGELAKAQRAGGGIEATITMLQLVSKAPRTVVEGISQRDLAAADRFFGAFSLGADDEIVGQDSFTLQLSEPAKIGEIVYAELKLREPVAKELARAQQAGSGIDATITLIQHVAQVPRRAVESITQRDLARADQYFGAFAVAEEGVTEMQDEMLLVLNKPVTVGDTECTELYLREPLAKELAEAQRSGDGVVATIALISTIAGVPLAVAENLSRRDLLAADRFLLVLGGLPRDWRDRLAETAKYFGWSPGDAWAQTWSQIRWWYDQGERINRELQAEGG